MKYEKPEDLDNITVQLPLSTARMLLSACALIVEKVQDSLKRPEVRLSLGPLQIERLNSHIESYQILKQSITKTINKNVGLDEQTAISKVERHRNETLIAEMKGTLYQRANDICDDPQCSACDEVRTQVSKVSKIKHQAAIGDSDFNIPENTIIVPGSEEEN